jgi:hypothetical protein
MRTGKTFIPITGFLVLKVKMQTCVVTVEFVYKVEFQPLLSRNGSYEIREYEAGLIGNLRQVYITLQYKTQCAVLVNTRFLSLSLSLSLLFCFSAQPIQP